MNPVFIVIFIFLAVFGSVYMLKPSIRDQRLAKLRLDAIKLGLQVKLDKFKADSKKTGVRDDIVAARYLRFDADVKSQEFRWCVVRQAGWDTEGLPEGWSWHGNVNAPETSVLFHFLEQLSDDIVVVEVYDNRTCLMTTEGKATSVDMINQWIDQAKQL